MKTSMSITASVLLKRAAMLLLTGEPGEGSGGGITTLDTSVRLSA